MRSLRYLTGYVVPAFSFVGILAGGLWSVVTPVVVFLLLPLVELVHPGTTANLGPEDEQRAATDRTYDLALYAAVPIQLALIGTFAWRVSTGALSGAVLAGAIVSVGISCGVLGINAAHELGHRPRRFEQVLAKLLLATSLYMHFFIEHNRGHTSTRRRRAIRRRRGGESRCTRSWCGR